MGSATPLLAVAEELTRECERAHLNCAMQFLGTRRGPERAVVAAAGMPFHAIPSGKLRRSWDVRNLVDLAVVKWACVVALMRLMRWRPSVVVGAGSFVQVPVVWAAALLRIPVVLLQLDHRPGLANRLGAPFARRILTAWPETAERLPRATVVGVPVWRAVREAPRDAVAAKRALEFVPDRPLLLVIGGSQGAARVNALLSGALPQLLEHASILHVVGPERVDAPSMPHSVSRIPHSRYRSVPFLTDDLPKALVAADLIVARAGMGTLSELAVLGKPAVIIPIAGSHQEENAAELARRGAVEAWDERTLTPEVFAERVIALLRDDAHRAALGRTIAVSLPNNAAQRVVDAVRAVANVPLSR